MDLAITGEGSIDRQTPRGKIPAEVARRAKEYQVSVIAIAGTIGDGANLNYEHGIDSFANILETPGTLEDAIANATELLIDAAERVMRLILVGQKLK